MFQSLSETKQTAPYVVNVRFFRPAKNGSSAAPDAPRRPPPPNAMERLLATLREEAAAEKAKAVAEAEAVTLPPPPAPTSPTGPVGNSPGVWVEHRRSRKRLGDGARRKIA